MDVARNVKKKRMMNLNQNVEIYFYTLVKNVKLTSNVLKGCYVKIVNAHFLNPNVVTTLSSKEKDVMMEIQTIVITAQVNAGGHIAVME